MAAGGNEGLRALFIQQGVSTNVWVADKEHRSKLPYYGYIVSI